MIPSTATSIEQDFCVDIIASIPTVSELIQSDNKVLNLELDGNRLQKGICEVPLNESTNKPYLAQCINYCVSGIHPSQKGEKKIGNDGYVIGNIPTFALFDSRKWQTFYYTTQTTTFHALLQVEIRYSFYSLDDS